MKNSTQFGAVFFLSLAVMNGPALAGPFKIVEKFVDKVVDKVVEHAHVPSSIDFRNESDREIIVVLDSGREERRIAAHAQATFGNLNVGDAPTFHVLNTDRVEVFARRIGPVGVHGSLGFNNSNSF